MSEKGGTVGAGGGGGGGRRAGSKDARSGRDDGEDKKKKERGSDRDRRDRGGERSKGGSRSRSGGGFSSSSSSSSQSALSPTDVKAKDQEKAAKEAAERAEREAKAKAEEEARQKAAAEEKVRKELQAQMEAQSQIEELKKAEEARASLRAANSAEAVKVSRAAHASNRSLKSDIKKTQTTVRKVKALSEEQRETLLRDIASTNLVMYISEVVTNVVEAKLKAVDMLAAIQVCSAFHQRYDGFTSALIPALAAVVLDSKISAPPGEDAKETARKKRQVFRLLIELFLVGVHQDYHLLVRIARSLLPPPPSSSVEGEGGGTSDSNSNTLRFRRQGPTAAAGQIDVGMLVTLVKFGGEEILGVVPRKVKALYQVAEMTVEEQPLKGTTGLVDAGIRYELRQCAEAAYETLCDQLLTVHENKQNKEKTAEKDRLLYGSLTEEKEKALEDLKKGYENLVKNMQSLSDGLDLDLHALPEEDQGDEEGGDTLGLSVWDGEMGGGANLGPYDDEESRAFYTDLPDLLAMLPSALLGLTEEEAATLRKENNEKEARQQEEEQAVGEEGEGMDVDQEGGSPTAEGGQGEEGVSAMDDSSNPQAEGEEEEKDDDDEDIDPPKLLEDEGGGGGDEGEAVLPAHHQVNHLLHEVLPICYNRDRADEFSLRFAHFNTKSARKRLVVILFNVPRQSLDLLPQYARIVATLDQVMKDLAPALLSELQAEFRYFQRKKPNSHLESKLKNVKYIGEFVKFKVAAPIIPFNILKVCLDHFTPHNVELACALLETCGRYLYRTPYTHARLNRYLEVMMRLKKVRHLDPSLETLIENAYYICNPPERTARKVQTLTPQQMYIRYLFFERLQEDTVEYVLQKVRELPWHSPQANIESFVMTCVIKAAKGRFHAVHLLADVLAGLATKWYEALTLRLVDRLIEELTRGMEQAALLIKDRDAQGHLALVKLLGEMYNYELVPNVVIFDTLYHFIHYGHEVPDNLKMPQINQGGNPLPPPIAQYVTHDPRVQTPIDPPGDTFRAQLVIKLLQVLDLLDELEGLVRSEKERQLEVEFQEGTASSSRGGRKEREAREKRKKEMTEALKNLIPRFNSWEEAQEVIDKWEREAHEMKLAKLGVEEEAKRGEETGAEEESSSSGEEDEEDDDESTATGGGEGEEGGREKKRRGKKKAGKEQTEEEEEEEEEEERPEGESSDEDSVTEVRREAHVKTDEDLELDAEFEKAFANMVINSVEERKSNARAGAAALAVDNMVLPSTLPKLLARSHEEARRRDDQEDYDEEEERGYDRDGGNGGKTSLAGTPGVTFCMLKRGNRGRLEARELVVPAYTSLAAQIRSHRDAEREERNVLKQKVLQYETQMMEAEEDEDEEGMSLPAKVYNAPLREEDFYHRGGGGAGGGRRGGRGGAAGGRGRGGVGGGRGEGTFRPYVPSGAGGGRGRGGGGDGGYAYGGRR